MSLPDRTNSQIREFPDISPPAIMPAVLQLIFKLIANPVDCTFNSAPELGFCHFQMIHGSAFSMKVWKYGSVIFDSVIEVSELYDRWVGAGS